MNDLDFLLLDAAVHADAAAVMHLVLEGRSNEADTYAQQPEVAGRIRDWKKARA